MLRGTHTYTHGTKKGHCAVVCAPCTRAVIRRGTRDAVFYFCVRRDTLGDRISAVVTTLRTRTHASTNPQVCLSGPRKICTQNVGASRSRGKKKNTRGIGIAPPGRARVDACNFGRAGQGASSVLACEKNVRKTHEESEFASSGAFFPR